MYTYILQSTKKTVVDRLFPRKRIRFPLSCFTKNSVFSEVAAPGREPAISDTPSSVFYHDRSLDTYCSSSSFYLPYHHFDSCISLLESMTWQLARSGSDTLFQLNSTIVEVQRQVFTRSAYLRFLSFSFFVLLFSSFDIAGTLWQGR